MSDAIVLAPGRTAVERVNNAIVLLRRTSAASPSVSAGVKRAIKDLHDHWQLTRASAGPISVSRLKRYAAWYARAWSLLSTVDRAKVPDPRSLDTTLTAAAEDALRAITESVGAAARAGADGAVVIANEAAKLGDEIGKSAARLAEKATSAFHTIAIVALAGLAMWAASKFYGAKGRT